jgi:hypothetical protein
LNGFENLRRRSRTIVVSIVDFIRELDKLKWRGAHDAPLGLARFENSGRSRPESRSVVPID